MTMQILNADYWSDYVKPYIADLGVALVFGVGYYLFNKIHKDKKYPGELKEKITTHLNKWSLAKTVQKFNSLIITNKDKTIDAFTILNQMQKKQINPDIITYNCLIDMSFKLEQYDQAKKLYEEISDFMSPVQPDIITYNILLKGYVSELRECYVNGKEKILEKVKLLMNELKAKAISPNDITYNTYIDACIEANDFESAWEYYSQMRETEVKPDLYTYATLIKGLKALPVNEEANLNRAVEILEMIKNGQCGELKVDEVLYNSVLDTCIKFNKIEMAEKLFEDMKEQNIQPSIITYSIMIKGYGIVYKLEKAINLFNEMKLRNVKPNDIIYGCLLNCAVRASRVDIMNDIYQSLRLDGLTPNNIIYTTLIKGYNKMRQYDKAFELFDSIPETVKETSTIVIYNAILDVCVESKNFEKLFSIYEYLKQKSQSNENFPQPNIITYSTVIKGLSKTGKLEEAKKLYSFLKENNYQLDEVLFNTLADAFARANEPKMVLSIIEDMAQYNVNKNSVLYSILIRMYSNMGNENQAIDSFTQMEKEGIKPSLVTYTTLMQMFIKNKKINNAINVYTEMRDKGYKIDQVTYNFIINGCTFNQKLEKAIEFLLESINANVKLVMETYNNVIEYLVNNKFMKAPERKKHAQEILKALKEKKLSLSDQVYEKVMKLLYKNGEKEIEENFRKTNYNDGYQNFSKGKDNLIKNRKHNYK